MSNKETPNIDIEFQQPRKGTFSITREIFDHPSFAKEPFTEREAWIWMIGAAAWKPTRVRAGRSVIILQRGQLAFSLRFLATKWGWSEPKVRRYLARRTSDAMVLVQATRQTTQITICNYDKYAFPRRTSDAQTDAPPDVKPTQRRISNKKEEEVSKSIRFSKSIIPDSWAISEVHYSLGAKAGLSREEIVEASEEMRCWSVGNGEKRSNWDAVFSNWLRRNAQKKRKANGNGFHREKTHKERYGDLLQSLGRGEVCEDPARLLPDIDAKRH